MRAFMEWQNGLKLSSSEIYQILTTTATTAAVYQLQFGMKQKNYNICLLQMLHDDWFDIYFFESHESQYNTIMHETHYPRGEKTVMCSTNSCKAFISLFNSIGTKLAIILRWDPNSTMLFYKPLSKKCNQIESSCLTFLIDSKDG